MENALHIEAAIHLIGAGGIERHFPGNRFARPHRWGPHFGSILALDHHHVVDSTSVGELEARCLAGDRAQGVRVEVELAQLNRHLSRLVLVGGHNVVRAGRHDGDRSHHPALLMRTAAAWAPHLVGARRR